jgi:predicted DNA-binding protein YlxM (UPF0122 family)
MILLKKIILFLIKKIVNELPPKNAAVVTMFYLEELSTEEISDVLQISVANVKVMLHRSRNLLREIIEKRNLVQEIYMKNINDELLNKYLDDELDQKEKELVRISIESSLEVKKEI